MNDLTTIAIIISISTLTLLIAVIASHITLSKKLGEKKQTTAITPPTAKPTSDEIPKEVVAAISAAIAAYTGLPEDKFVVRSVRRVGSWNDTAKREYQRRIY